MIVVKVELWSAITGNKTELARMHISNDATGTVNHMNYDGVIFRGRSKEDLDKGTVLKTGKVLDWPSDRVHIWNLVTKMLSNIGYK